MDCGPLTRPQRHITLGDRVRDRFEQGGVHHPHEGMRRRVEQPQPAPDFQPGRAQQGLGRGPGTGREEDTIPRLGTGRRPQPGPFGLGQVLGHRPTQLTLRVEGDIGQPLGTALAGPVLPGVESPPRLGTTPGHHHRTHVRGLEDSETGAGEIPGEFGELQVKPQIGLVRAVPVHRLGVADPRERGADINAGEFPDFGKDLFGQCDHVVLVHEAHLNVELGKFRLPVGAEVLVTVAAGDLVVALHAGHHQQLLE